MAKEHEAVIRCKILQRTTDALLIRAETGEGEEDVWIPQSTVNQIHEQDGYIVTERWIAERKGLV